jgi:uncharacterized membrane protein YeaQ/YmgE (transglycosylase-associated protein family)
MAVGAGIGFVVLIFIILAIGAIAGWLAGKIMSGHGFGFFANAGLGILGALIGSFVFGMFGIYTVGIIPGIIKATIGAVIVLAIAHAIRRRA